MRKSANKGESASVSDAPCRAPRLKAALARLVDLKAALLAEARARDCRNWHGARATSSVDGWASMALRSDVVEAAGARSSERDFNPRAPLTLSSVKGHRGRVNTRGPSLENDIACVL